MLQLFVMHLGYGSSLVCCTIKGGTIAKYLQAVRNFLQHLNPEQLDPVAGPPIKAVLTKLEHWETVPNHREPYTLQMHTTLQLWTVGLDSDSFYSDYVYWFLLGIYLGFCRSEWAQSCTSYRLSMHQMNCLCDLQFHDISGRRLPHP
jgi:hypothetical protein